MSRNYRPRVVALLDVPLAAGKRFKSDSPSSAETEDYVETISFPVRVKNAKLVLNDHNHADSAHLVMDWRDAGTDPRYLAGAIVTIWMGDADEHGNFEPSDATCRFIGRMARPMRRADANGPLLVEGEFLDYTSFFLMAKPFATAGIPEYSQTLDDAWRRICQNTPGAESMAERIEFIGVKKPPELGKALSARLREAKFHPKADADAWAIWQQCVGACGLISYIKLDRCIVTTATDYYTAGNPPVLLWGKNLLSMTEERNNERAMRGVGIQSFNPLTGVVIEALWPPIGDARVKHKKISAKRKQDKAALAAREERDFFQYGGITEEAQALVLAKRVYEERSRQEMEGTVTTKEMSVERASGADFDLLDLQSGDVLRVDFGPDEREALASIPSESDRIAYLVSRGYEDSVATIMARNVDDLLQLESSFYVKTVNVSLDSSPEGGSFQVEINYCNRILTSGAAPETAPG